MRTVIIMKLKQCLSLCQEWVYQFLHSLVKSETVEVALYVYANLKRKRDLGKGIAD